MARITVEDCLVRENNRFALVLLAAKRTKQLLGGSKALVTAKSNKHVVTSLREIADGQVRFMTEEEVKEHQALEEAMSNAVSKEPFAAPVAAADDANGAKDRHSSNNEVTF
jgi:DNA-directed RNA polymerase subunit omega